MPHAGTDEVRTGSVCDEARTPLLLGSVSIDLSVVLMGPTHISSSFGPRNGWVG